MRLVDRIVWMPPQDIAPFHEEIDPSRTKKLASSMARNSWAGRPLVVMDLPDGTLKAITGSHRLRAATAIGMSSVPVIKLTPRERDAVVNAFPWFHKNRQEVWCSEGDAPLPGNVAEEIYEAGSQALADLVGFEEHEFPIEKMTKRLRERLLYEGVTEEAIEVLS